MRNNLRGYAMLCLVMLCGRLRADEQQHIADTVLTGARETARAISSIQFRAKIREGNGWTSEVTYVKNGGMYRIDRRDTPPVDMTTGTSRSPRNPEEAKAFVEKGYRKPLDVTFAYNGSRFQDFDNNDSVLRLSSPSNDYVQPSLILSPLQLAYGWLLDAADHNQAFSHQDEDAWQQRMKDGRYKSTEERNGLKTQVLVFPQKTITPKGGRFEVGFVEEYGYLPVFCDCYVGDSSTVASTCVVEQTVKLPGASLPRVFPTKVRFNQSGDDKISTQMKYEIEIVPQTLYVNERVNERVDEALFTLDKTAAKRVLDNDVILAEIKKTEAIHRDADSPIEEVRTSPARRTLICVNILLVIGLCFLLWRKWR